VLNSDGVYSQLILLQESYEENKMERQFTDPRSKSTSLSMKRSISGSVGNSSGHSFTLPFGLPSTVELTEGSDTHGHNHTEHNVDGEIPIKSPMLRLAHLNKPEAPILLLGSLEFMGCFSQCLVSCSQVPLMLSIGHRINSERILVFGV
jgi:ATP-binding cassette subfamily B (MDR/TAP) protein 1